jgi:hypothetical protein
MKNYAAADDQVVMQDCFATPSYAVAPLLPYLEQFHRVWEPACGEGYLVRTLRNAGKRVIYSDLQLGDNYFADDPPSLADVQVTNVPFGKKYRWILRALEKGLPFALLMPSGVLQAGTSFFRPVWEQYDVRFLWPRSRISFKTPVNGWVNADGKKSSAQMHTAWLTYGLGLPERITGCDITIAEEPPLEAHEQICGDQSLVGVSSSLDLVELAA